MYLYFYVITFFIGLFIKKDKSSVKVVNTIMKIIATLNVLNKSYEIPNGSGPSALPMTPNMMANPLIEPKYFLP
jgi:hypothetical protein